MRARRFWVTYFAAHFLLLLAISGADILFLVARGSTVLPHFVEAPAGRSGAFFSDAGARIPAVVPMAVRTYLHLAGIESGYGFFAPNVPDNFQLVFELHFPDGRVEYEVAGIEGRESSLRLASLLDLIGRTPVDRVREILLKLLAHAVWRQHPDATMIRAILGSQTMPSAKEFRANKQIAHEFLYSYDFVRAEPTPAPSTP